MAAPRPRLAVYWASGCGGCEAAFLDLGTRLLEFERAVDIVFFPLLCDSKLAGVRALPDRSVDVAIITGAIRTAEDADVVGTLRRVSSRLVALGSCSLFGSVLGLANLTPRETILEDVYGGPGPGARLPSSSVADVPSVFRPGAFLERVQPLEAAVSVDYSVPGCPPEAERLWEVLQLFVAALAGNASFPEQGTVLGVRDGTVCEECARPRPEARASRFVRLHEVAADPSRCLLEQGLVCSGPATRAGCGAVCPAAGVGCRGCYGGPEGTLDQAARTLAALTSLAGVSKGETDATGEDLLRRRVDEEVESLVDPVGTLCRYTFPVSLLARIAGKGRVDDEPGEKAS